MVEPLHRIFLLGDLRFFEKKLGGGFKQEVREENWIFVRTEEPKIGSSMTPT
jgi:hypothetical protein